MDKKKNCYLFHHNSTSYVSNAFVNLEGKESVGNKYLTTGHKTQYYSRRFDFLWITPPRGGGGGHGPHLFKKQVISKLQSKVKEALAPTFVSLGPHFRQPWPPLSSALAPPPLSNSRRENILLLLSIKRILSV